MRIQSDFKDFYDVGMSLGMDQTMIYQRRKEVKELEWNDRFGWVMRESRYSAMGAIGGFVGYYQPKLVVQTFVIGFAGKIHLCYEVNLLNAYTDSKDGRATRAYCYNIDQIDTYIRHHFKDDEYADFLNEAQYDRDNKGLWPFAQRRRSFVHTFTEFAKYEMSYGKFFEKFRCPVFRVYDENNKQMVVLNECLKPYDFIKVEPDPYAAYQKIAMFFGNMAEPRKPIPVPDDVTMAEIKGFDKFSFRKDPSSKKRKK